MQLHQEMGLRMGISEGQKWIAFIRHVSMLIFVFVHRKCQRGCVDVITEL